MFDFKKQTVENQIGMRKEDNPRLFDSVYRQLFGTDYEESDKSRFDFSDNDSDMETTENFV